MAPMASQFVVSLQVISCFLNILQEASMVRSISSVIRAVHEKCITLRNRFIKFINPNPTSGTIFVKIPLLRVPEIYGICGPNRTPIKCFMVHLMMGIVFMIIPTIISIINEDSTHGRIKKSGYLVFLTTAAINFTTVAWKREKFDRLLELLEEFYRTASGSENGSENKKIIDSTSNVVMKINRWYLRYYGFPSYVLFIIIPVLYTLITYILWPEQAKVLTPTEFGPADFYLDYTSSVWRVILFYIVSWPAVTFMFLLVMADSCFFSFVAYYCLPTFELTIASVKRLSTMDPKSITAEHIGENVRMHATAIECFDLLDDLLHIVFLCYRLCFVVVWCFVLFGATTYSTEFPVDKVFGFVVCAAMRLLAMSLLGKRLNDLVLTESLSDEINNIQWYDSSKSARKSIHLMLGHSQKRVGLTAGKFHYVDMESFSEIVQSSYSYYVVLKNMYD